MILLLLADKDGAIAKDGKQILFIPEDLARFKARTAGGVLVMGRKTFENTGALSGRISLVMSRSAGVESDEVHYFSSESELDAHLAAYADRPVFLVGGAATVRRLYDRIEEAYITRVDRHTGGEVKMPDLAADFVLSSATLIAEGAIEEHWVRKDR
ncbi:dihydrofolate reductase [Peptoniphilus ivorii]|uniref:dihydrofolate reductase n=1 Tax=Aedoeadaptatus ivorii TaxID=54006 RepID=UPI002788638D|nr:dihydrofolate reductase [Peptoniphilus ivorii]MDQ0508809.1 dihydrofolate reductase [Peptoniphilus ivorii]